MVARYVQQSCVAFRPCLLMQSYTIAWDFHVEGASVATWNLGRAGGREGSEASTATKMKEGELHPRGDRCLLRLALRSDMGSSAHNMGRPFQLCLKAEQVLGMV